MDGRGPWPFSARRGGDYFYFIFVIFFPNNSGQTFRLHMKRLISNGETEWLCGCLAGPSDNNRFEIITVCFSHVPGPWIFILLENLLRSHSPFSAATSGQMLISLNKCLSMVNDDVLWLLVAG